MKHILITAGGTVEAIDGVRKISNTSTGSLSACIYEALSEHIAASAERDSGFMVHYVVSETAVRPEAKENLPIVFYPVTDVKSVEAVLEKLMTSYNIAYVIHGMAVSDFTKDYLIEREELIGELAETLDRVLNSNQEKLSAEKLRGIIRDILISPTHRMDASSKISSKAELMLSLKRTPKLIEKVKKLNPETFLVGFKLLKGVSEEELIQVAAELSKKSACDLVLANDMNHIKNGRHEGLLLKGRHIVGRYSTKQEIARGIAEQLLSGAFHALTMNGDCL